MESYHNPESRPFIRPASVEAPAQLQYEDHNALHHDMLEAADLLSRYTPEAFNVQLSGIPLHGTVPLTMQGEVGTNHQHMSFSAGKDAEHEGGYMRLWLHGRDPYNQPQFISQSEPVEYGRNKLFGMQPYGFEQPVSSMTCDDLCVLLDDLLPDASRRFSSLVDPRSDKTFDVIAAAMSSILAERAKKSQSRRTYTARDNQISFTGGDVFDIETTVALDVISNNKDRVCSLTVSSPVQVELGQIEQSVQYSFIRQSYKHKGRIQQPYVPTAKVILSSVDVPAVRLSEYIPDVQASSDARQILERGLDILLAAPRAA